MNYFIDLRQKTIKPLNGRIKCNKQIISIRYPALDLETIKETTSRAVDEALKARYFNTVPTLFSIEITNEYDQEDPLDDDFFGVRASLISDCFCDALLIKPKAPRENNEYRLDVPKELKPYVHLNRGFLKDLLNYQCRCNRFNLHIAWPAAGYGYDRIMDEDR